MKVCILSTSFPRFSGDYVANFFLEIAKKFKEKDNDVCVICPHQKGIKEYELINGIAVNRFKYLPERWENLAYGDGMAVNLKKSLSLKLSSIPFMLSFFVKALLKARKSDIIIANFVPAAFVGLMIKKLYRIPVILTEHRIVEDSGIFGKFNRYIFEQADYVIFNSSYTQKKVLKFSKPKGQKIIFVGIDASRFKNEIKKPAQDEKLKLISIGRLIEKKGYNYLIDAIDIVNKKYPDRIELNIIGWGSLEEQLKKQINELKLNNVVHLIGGKSPEEIPNYLNQSDIFVLTSIIDSMGETETLGVVFLEAMACGLPVIGSNVGGIVDVIIDGKTGYFTEPKSPEDIAEKIIKLINSSADMKDMSKNARKRAEETFDWNQIIEEYIKVTNLVIHDIRN